MTTKPLNKHACVSCGRILNEASTICKLCVNKTKINERYKPQSQTRTTKQQQKISGVGTELRLIIPKWFDQPGCGCKDYSEQLDLRGLRWCIEHKAEIIEHLVAKATKTFIGSLSETLDRYVATRWVDKAIGIVLERNQLPVVTSAPFDRLSEVQLTTFHYNPCGFNSLRDTYYQWRDLLGPLAPAIKCYELVFDDDAPEIEGSIVIRGTRKDNLMWQKEALVNVALYEAPQHIRYFGWLDHDFVFDDPDWLLHATDMIDRGTPAVQLFRSIHYADKYRLPGHKMHAAVWRLKTNGTLDANPGGAWLASRRLMDRVGGLFEFNIAGGGDQTWIDAVRGEVGKHVLAYPSALQDNCRSWINKVYLEMKGQKAGYIDCNAVHLWHGTMKNRQYKDRNKILSRYNLDPNTDVVVDTETGLLKWTSDKTAMHKEMAEYFAKRKEDDG